MYLHDTPSRGLFAKQRWDFSHGCIRVADPVALAQLLLAADSTWTPERIEQAMQRNTPTTVRLARPVLVLIMYATTMATENGALLFYDDIYRHDRSLERLVAAQYPYAH